MTGIEFHGIAAGGCAGYMGAVIAAEIYIGSAALESVFRKINMRLRVGVVANTHYDTLSLQVTFTARLLPSNIAAGIGGTVVVE